MKNLLLIAIFLLTVQIGFSQMYTHKMIIDGTLDTASAVNTDTLTSGWVPLGGALNAAITYNTDDTSYAKGIIEYRYGTYSEQLTSITLGTADSLSLDTRGSALTGLSKGKILQGYGLATSLIPGANAIKVTMWRLAGTEATSTLNVGLILY